MVAINYNLVRHEFFRNDGLFKRRLFYLTNRQIITDQSNVCIVLINLMCALCPVLFKSQKLIVKRDLNIKL